jgi:transcriptional regulator with XRE-family HTH domain
MNYAKAIRIARALADVSQRELAKRISVDASLISLLERGQRKPSLKTLENIAESLGLPFHLFALLASEVKDAKVSKAEEIHQLAVALTKLLLRGDGNESPRGSLRKDRETGHSKSQSTRAHSRRQRRNAV